VDGDGVCESGVGVSGVHGDVHGAGDVADDAFRVGGSRGVLG
jgi:hypothetical protein